MYIIYNHKGDLRKLWYLKKCLLYRYDINKIEITILVSRQWMLATHDRKKEYVPKSQNEGQREHWFWRKLEGKIIGFE